MMNPVNTGFRRPLDGATERKSISAVAIAVMGVAVFIVGGVLFYTLSSSP